MVLVSSIHFCCVTLYKYYDMSVENKNRVTDFFFTSEKTGSAIRSNSLVLKYNRTEIEYRF
jgi:hypothetical protein